MSYRIKLEVFEGPFDLLFHLIEKNEVDIYDIPIADITRQYLDYLDQARSFDLELASEFLVMAATLLSIKARMLLPKPAKTLEEGWDNNGLDPRDELVERLLEYKKYKNMANYFESLEDLQGKVFSRPNDPEAFLGLFGEINPLEGLTLLDLVNAFRDVLDKAEPESQIREIHREEITIKKKMDEIVRILTQRPKGITFHTLFSHPVGRTELVVQFLALLELVRLQAIKIRQSVICGEIMIFSAPGTAGEDVE